MSESPVAVVASWVTLAASFALSYATWLALGELAGYGALAFALALCVDGYIVVALVTWLAPVSDRVARFARWNTYGAAGVGVLAQSTYHGASVYAATHTSWRAVLATVVGALPPLVSALSVHLRGLVRHAATDPAMPIAGPDQVALEDASGVPVFTGRSFGKTSVYRLMGADDALLYVGIAADVAVRVGEHRRKKTWWSEVVRIEVAVYATRGEALLVERDTIRDEQPRYNIEPGALTDYHHWTPCEIAAEPVETYRAPVVGGRPAPVSDEDLISAIREWVVREGSVPSRERVRTHFGIGTKRADRVRTAAVTPRDPGSDQAIDAIKAERGALHAVGGAR